VTGRSHYLACEGREIHYLDWGAADAPVVVAWHGLARTSRDMDDIASHLAARYRVVCPDTIGRGLSQWSPAPEKEYCLEFYARLAVALLDQLGIRECAWLGTSMGGAIGIRLAAGAAVARIRSYAGSPPQFDTVGELEAYFRTVYKPYGWLSDAQWRLLTETSLRRLPDGRVTPHYDPAMVRQFVTRPDDYERWAEWDSLSLPVLCLRGAGYWNKPRETAEAMRVRGPCAAVATIPGCGHAPALNVPAQLELVRRFLEGA